MPHVEPEFAEEAVLRRLPDYVMGMSIPVVAALRRSGKLEAAHVIAAGRHYRTIEAANGQHPETGEGEHMQSRVAKSSYDGGMVALVDARAHVAHIREALGERLYATLEVALACGLSARAIAAMRGEVKDVTVGRIVAALDSLTDFSRLYGNRIPAGYKTIDTGSQS